MICSHKRQISYSSILIISNLTLEGLIKHNNPGRIANKSIKIMINSFRKWNRLIRRLIKSLSLCPSIPSRLKWSIINFKTFLILWIKKRLNPKCHLLKSNIEVWLKRKKNPHTFKNINFEPCKIKLSKTLKLQLMNNFLVRKETNTHIWQISNFNRYKNMKFTFQDKEEYLQ